MALTQVSTGGIKDGQVQTADLADSQVTAAKLHADALDRTYTLGADGSNHYTFTGEGLTGAVNDPTLYLTRGKTYRFVNGNSAGAHPFRIQTTVNGSAGTEYNTGVTNNGGAGGSTIIFEVPHDAPDVLYYQCTSHNAMGGILYITGALADGGVTTAKLANNSVTLGKLFQHTGTGFIATANNSDCVVNSLPNYNNNGETFIIHDLQCQKDSSNANPVIGAAGGGTSLTFRTNQDGSSGSGIASILDSTGLQMGRMSAYVKLAAPVDQSGQASYTFTFPPISGNSGQVLSTNGSGTTSWTTVDLTSLSASNLTSGTIPDARFPATLPAVSGANLTGIVSFVSGMIILWSGAENAIPSGWVLCNGSNSTPDLRDRFVVGAGKSYAVGATGGSNTATDSVSIGFSVSVSGTTGNQGTTGSGGPGWAQGNPGTQNGYNHAHSFSGSGSGSGSDTVSIDTRSPYYALCYIMKT